MGSWSTVCAEECQRRAGVPVGVYGYLYCSSRLCGDVVQQACPDRQRRCSCAGDCLLVGAAITEQWTGGGMNPARAFGPALVADRFDDHWVWWVAPYVAALIVIPLAAFVFNVAEMAFVSSGSSRPVAADEEEGHPMRVVDQK